MLPKRHLVEPAAPRPERDDKRRATPLLVLARLRLALNRLREVRVHCVQELPRLCDLCLSGVHVRLEIFEDTQPGATALDRARELRVRDAEGLRGPESIGQGERLDDARVQGPDPARPASRLAAPISSTTSSPPP